MGTPVQTPTWKNRHRKGLPLITPRLMRVLQILRDAQAGGTPFVALNLHYRTRDSLIERDWVIESKGLDGVRYKITGRGLKALKVYEPQGPRYDGICPTCGIRPKKVSRNGVVYGYCDECNKLHGKRQYAFKGHQFNPDAPCSRCGAKPRYICSTGFVKVYCADCLKASQAEARRRKHARLLERIANGEVILCIRCRQNPRYHTGRLVYDYCRECYQQQQKTWRENGKQRRHSETAR